VSEGRRGTIHVIAGTNGAGKSTIAGTQIRRLGGEYFNPDEATQRILQANPGAALADANSAAWHHGREMLERAIEEQWYDRELMGNHMFHMGLGFIRNSPGEAELGPNPNAFGHGGAGGSVGFADMNENLGFSYSMNNMHAGIDLGPRCGRLVEAVYRCL